MLDFSVVVPTYERPSALRRLLQGVAEMEYSRERFEVIVVNDGGATLTVELTESFRNAFVLRVFEQANPGQATPRNYGAQVAQGKWLAFIDDDCVPERDWLNALSQALDASVLVGGNVENAFPENLYATASQLLFDYLYNYYHGRDAATVQKPFFTSNNLALARSMFLQYGGFDVRMRLGEDREFCVRLAEHGVAQVYAPHARVRHFRELNAKAFWKQHFQYGRGAFDYHSHLRARERDTLLPEPFRFYVEMLRYPYRRAEQKATRLMLLLVLSQIANLCGFFAAGWQMLRLKYLKR